MLAWIIRALLVLASLITSLFVAHDDLNYNVIQTIIAALLFTLLVSIIAFWPAFKAWFIRWSKK
jgi:hypothetical protein